MIAVGVLVTLVVIAYHINRAGNLTSTELAVTVLSVVLFVAAIITGGLLSIEGTMPRFGLLLHQVGPVLVVQSTGITLYLLLFHKT